MVHNTPLQLSIRQKQSFYLGLLTKEGTKALLIYRRKIL